MRVQKVRETDIPAGTGVEEHDGEARLSVDFARVRCGIFLRAGTAVISDSTLGTSYNKTDEYLTQDWVSGTGGVRAALTLGNRNGTYYADAVCTLKGKIEFDLAEDTKAPLIYVYANEDKYEGINDNKPFTTTLDYTAATGVGFEDIVVGKGSAAVKVIPAQP